MRRLTKKEIESFQRLVYRHFEAHGRDLPWRKTHDPYAIVVSEIMLQQTQVERVIDKYRVWMQHLPNWQALAEATWANVAELWLGLGYNRRAKNLQLTAKQVVKDFDGQLPQDESSLTHLPGIGPYTANAIRAFAFNQPAVVLETNIRTVYLYYFINNMDRVDDAQLAPLVEQTMDRTNPRKWFNALMDYGAFLKTSFGNHARRSKHYRKQSNFDGSDRKIRGRIIQLLVVQGTMSRAEFDAEAAKQHKRWRTILDTLVEEKMIRKSHNGYRL